MATYYYALSSDYTGGPDLGTFRIEFRDPKTVDAEYEGDMEKVPYEKRKRAGRCFVLRKKWDDRIYNGLHIDWQDNAHEKDNVIQKDGTTIKAIKWVIERVKELLGIKFFDIVYRSEAFKIDKNR